MSRRTSLLVVLVLLLWLLPSNISAQALKVGIVMDGPFDRNQAQTSEMIKTAISAFDGGKTVEFPPDQRRLGCFSGRYGILLREP